MYYVLPRVIHPLRIDPIPPGAYIVPWMRQNPSIEELSLIMPGVPPWNIDAVMSEALRIEMIFRVVTLSETRVIPGEVYLGHDRDVLYIGGIFRGMYMNPASHPPDDPELVLPNIFNIFFDVANDGVLSFPESGSHIAVSLSEDASWHTGAFCRYDDNVWDNHVDAINRSAWIFAENYYSPNAKPASDFGGIAMEYDSSTGTLIILFSRLLSQPALDANGLQMRSGERWAMGFLLELGYATWYGPYQNFVDGWPRNIYPYLSNDSSWWPKLVIDLANPPANM